MLIFDSFVFSHFVYGLPGWGPSLNVNLFHHITRLHNHGVRMTSGLRKYDHVSHHRFALGWLPVGSACHLASFTSHYVAISSVDVCC